MISYAHSDQIFTNYKPMLVGLIRLVSPRRVVEIGGGAAPALSLSEISHLNISEYTLLDISQAELAKAPDGYAKQVCDICSPKVPTGYDLAISHYLAEHIPDAQKFHSNVFQMLNPGGYAFHCFPTMFSVAYIANVLIPEGLGQKLVTWTDPQREQSGTQGKFPARYKWCFGPTRKNIERFHRIGFEVERYQGFFGHYYYRKLPPLHFLHRMKTALLLSHPIPQLTTVASVLLRKPY